MKNLYQPHTDISIQDFNDAEKVIHHAAQFLAMFGKNYVDQQSDDSNANLKWNEKKQRLESRSALQHQLCLHLPTFSLQWMYKGENLSTFDLNDHQKTEAYDWLKIQLKNHGFDPLSLNYIDHYQIPTHAVDKGSPFQKPKIDLIDEWMIQRTNANIILESVNNLMGQNADIRIWPHHFDTGVYYPFDENKAIGAGWATADGLSGVPYLYLYPWERGRSFVGHSIKFPLTYGRWENNEWTGAILDWSVMSNTPQLKKIVDVFLKEVLPQLKASLLIT